MKYEKPKGNFLMLESLYSEKHTSRSIYVIRPDASKTSFMLGRG